MLNIWHVGVQTLINHSRLRIYLKPVFVWSLSPNSSTDCLCNAVVSDILMTQLCTQCTLHLWLNHIPLQSDPYEPTHLIESLVGYQRDIDNITPHPCPHTITPSADLRLRGQHLSLAVCCHSTLLQASPLGESVCMVKPKAKGHYEPVQQIFTTPPLSGPL